MSHGLSALVTQLTSEDVAQRRAAAESLARFGPGGVTAAERLVEACADEDEQVRDWVVAALEELPAPTPDQAPALGQLVSQANVDVAFWAATLLGRMGPRAAAVVADLAAALATHPELVVRERAAWALGRIGVAARPAIRQLESACRSSDARLARLAQQALGAIQSPPEGCQETP